MTLRKKTLLIIGVTLVSLVLVLYNISANILLSGFNQLEEQNMRMNLERASSAISHNLDELNTSNINWSMWDDSYAFVAEPTEDYIQSNLYDNAFEKLKLNLMLFVRSSGQLVYGKAFDLQREQQTSLPQNLPAYLKRNPPALRHADPNSNRSGIILLPKDILLVSSRPVLTSEGKGPIRGSLILGQYLNEAKLQALEHTTRLSLTVHRLDQSPLPPDYQAALTSLANTSTSTYVQPLSEDQIAGYTLLEDIEGRPALLLRVDTPRAIYQEARISQKALLWTLLGIGLVFGCVALLLLEKLVLARLAQLSASVRSIRSSDDLDRRVLVKGKDELSSLARAINRMLETLAQLHQQSQKQVQELQQLSLLKDDFLSTVSHELRTPLTNIRMAIRMLQLSETQEQRSRYLAVLQAECNREVDLVNDLLDLQRLEADSYPISLQTLHLDEWLPEILQAFQSRLNSRQQTLQVELSPELPPLLSDQAGVTRILSELLNNACKYTISGGKIALSVRCVTQPQLTDRTSSLAIAFCVANEAEIPATDLPRIFEKFYRVPEADRWKQGGTGLGLSLVKNLVEHLRGKIQVESRDGWTQFTVELPATAEPCLR
ncbi:CHASE4 domain-containing protein [Leptolyngbya sp. FACHB-261]|uniref:sensor histidine kinase n=1 Tax=Leptolyngbya sp. FACHB-261 TaxID=2692806 RepID=UPI00168605CF|nr:CHASE4 domain-containing protein [Leptolyngbya sp. FACHB-261]MBD2104344.1 HAMP domain-containing protein [Leptolyngbya sp. FACHB-261]